MDNQCNNNWVVRRRLCRETCRANGQSTQDPPPTSRSPSNQPPRSPSATLNQPQPQNSPLATFDFYVGVNVPWVMNRYGWAFGRHTNWGQGYTDDSKKWSDTFFRDLDSTVPADANLGILARLFLFGDLRGGVNMDGSNAVALPQETISDIIDFLDRAKTTRVKMVLSLLDFHICDEKSELLSNDNYLKSFIDNVVVPLLKSIKNHPSVAFIEGMNEPEWCIKESGRAFTKQQVSAYNIQRYVGMVNTAVKTYTNFLTCDGSGSPMWGHFWKDNQLKTAYPEGGDSVKLDWYQTHMYSFSIPEWDTFSKSVDQLFGRDKKVLIGEVPGKFADNYSNEDKLRLACQKGYNGVLFWSYGANDGVAAWDDMKTALSNFKGCNM